MRVIEGSGGVPGGLVLHLVGLVDVLFREAEGIILTNIYISDNIYYRVSV